MNAKLPTCSRITDNKNVAIRIILSVSPKNMCLVISASPPLFQQTNTDIINRDFVGKQTVGSINRGFAGVKDLVHAVQVDFRQPVSFSGTLAAVALLF